MEKAPSGKGRGEVKVKSVRVVLTMAPRRAAARKASREENRIIVITEDMVGLSLRKTAKIEWKKTYLMTHPSMSENAARDMSLTRLAIAIVE